MIQNHNLILDFMRQSYDKKDFVANAVKATIAQFLTNFKQNIIKCAGSKNKVSQLDIINSQIKVLRQCVIDLENCKKILTKGVTLQ